MEASERPGTMAEDHSGRALLRRLPFAACAQFPGECAHRRPRGTKGGSHRGRDVIKPKSRRDKGIRVVIVGGSYIRAQYGYPCFFCGSKLKKCRARRGRCCKRCKGMRSHD
jgi:hypothetical protein